MNSSGSRLFVGIGLFAIISMVVAMVAMGPQVKNMFSNAVSGQGADNNRCALSATIYGGSGYSAASASVPQYRAAAASSSRWYSSRSAEAPAVPAATMRRSEMAGTYQPVAIPEEEQTPISDGSPERTEHHGNSCLEVDDAREAGKQVTKLVKEMGGAVLSSQTAQGAQNADVEVKMRLRIPNERFDEFVAGIRELGKITAENVQSLDRTQDYRELEAELGSRQRAIASVDRQIGTATSAQEALPLMQQRQQLVEQCQPLEAAQRRLAARTNYTIYSITLREISGSGSVIIPGGVGGRLGGAFATAVDYGTTGLAYIVIGVGAALPWAMVAAVLWYVTKRRRPRPDSSEGDGQ